MLIMVRGIKGRSYGLRAGNTDPLRSVAVWSIHACFAAIAAARRRIAIYRLLTHSSHPSSDADDCPITGFRCAADSDHQVEVARSLDILCHIERAGACDPLRS